mgnify:CR=1 FL=1
MTRQQRIELPPYSMFSQTPVHEIDVLRSVDPSGKLVVFGLLTEPLVKHSSDAVFRIPQGFEDRLDRISNRFYGTPDLWWAIAMVNNSLDPMAGFSRNQEIRVPLRSRLAKEGLLTV